MQFEAKLTLTTTLFYLHLNMEAKVGIVVPLECSYISITR